MDLEVLHPHLASDIPSHHVDGHLATENFPTSDALSALPMPIYKLREVPRISRPSPAREDGAVKSTSVHIIVPDSFSVPQVQKEPENDLSIPRRHTVGSHVSHATVRTSQAGTIPQSEVSDGTARSIFPDEKLVEKGNVYLLYRGILCYAEISRAGERSMVDSLSVFPEKSAGSPCCLQSLDKNRAKAIPLRVWVDVYRMDLCVAPLDSPANPVNRFPINYISYPVPDTETRGTCHEINLSISAHHASSGDCDDSHDITPEQRNMRPTTIRMFTMSPDEEAENLKLFPETLAVDTSLNARVSRMGSKKLGAMNNKSLQNTDLPVPLFFDVLQRLRHCFETDWPAVSHIKRNVYQYLWRNRALAMTDIEMMEGQATLAFNLDPKMGIQYLKSKVLAGKQECMESENAMTREIGKWLVRMSAANKGGIDPSILGIYFARKDTDGIYTHFLSFLNFCAREEQHDVRSRTSRTEEREDVNGPESVMGLVPALRYLFATFKPVGEMQILDRLLKHFAEEYFRLLQDPARNISAKNKGLRAKKADTLHVLCFAAIMCNHELNMAPKMLKKGIEFTPRTVEQFLLSVRQTNISEEEVDDEYIFLIYDEVKRKEIQMQPLPRVPFNDLPVQPDIEGWLVVILKGRPAQRFWAVVAMQRLYLFSDSDEINAFLCIDLKNVSARSVDREFLKRALQKRSSSCSPFLTKDVPVDRAFILSSPDDAPLVHDVPPPSSLQSQPVLQRVVKSFFGALVPQKLRWVVCVAESKDMSDKWMNSWDQSLC